MTKDDRRDSFHVAATFTNRLKKNPQIKYQACGKYCSDGRSGLYSLSEMVRLNSIDSIGGDKALANTAVLC